MSGTGGINYTDDGRPARPSLPSLLQRALLGGITAYQRWVSPALPVVTLGTCACRFSPTCSHYAAEAVTTHGAVRGVWLTIRRLAKCGPWHPGGVDPVPSREVIPTATTSAFLDGRAGRASLPRRHCRAI